MSGVIGAEWGGVGNMAQGRGEGRSGFDVCAGDRARQRGLLQE